MKRYKLMSPSFLDYNTHNQKMSNHPLFADNPRPIFNSIEDTLDYITTDIGVVQNFYDSHLPKKERVLARTKYLAENSTQRIVDQSKQKLLDDEIKNMNMCLTQGQIIFHGGVEMLPSYITEPLSTSFSPTRAYMNAIHNGKAFDAGRLVLYCLNVMSDRPVYVYQQRSPDEHEVIFASGFQLRDSEVYNSEKIFFDNGRNGSLEVDLTIIKASIY